MTQMYTAVILVGPHQVPDEDLPSVREMYKKKHPNAYWVDFGDFRLMRMDTIKAMRFVGGFAMAGDIDPEGKDTVLSPVKCTPQKPALNVQPFNN